MLEVRASAKGFRGNRKMPKVMSTKTCRCGQPAKFKSWVGRMRLKADGNYSKRVKREPRWMCLSHYLENVVGLWPYCCVRACVKKRAAVSNAQSLAAEEFVVWLPLDMIVSTRDKAMRPR